MAVLLVQIRVEEAIGVSASADLSWKSLQRAWFEYVYKTWYGEDGVLKVEFWGPSCLTILCGPQLQSIRS